MFKLFKILNVHFRIFININILFLTLFLYIFTYSYSIHALEPPIHKVDLGSDQNKPMSCSGKLVLFRASLNPKSECEGSESCVHVLVQECPIWKTFKAVACNSISMNSDEIIRINSLPFINDNTDIDILLSLQKEGLLQSDEKFMQAYIEKRDEKISKMPTVKLSGILENCTVCPQCEPKDTCMLQECSLDIIK